ncbi:hypothetical protein Tco_0627340 [Tanacetum coccineum]|uniref:UBN2 domain-containing protein n=1 Tax=Tanacetum coccineum TaxID=301880 RepID=A0ABQ4WMD0_9ASTR
MTVNGGEGGEGGDERGFARFNIIITSLKALDEGFSSKNYVRKFLRSLHPKWREKVMAIEESKYLSSLALDELIVILKVHKVVMEKDSEIYRGKKEIVKSIALKAKKESSDDETLTSGSDDEEYAMAVRNFKKFFIRKGKFVRQPREEKNMQLEYDNLCGISLKIINKNKVLKTKRDLLEKDILELNEKNKKLERNKEIDITCKFCQELKLEDARLKETQVKFVKFDKSANSLREMLNNQKSSSCKIGLGFDSSKASTSGTKPINFVGSSAEIAPDGSTIKAHGSTKPGSVDPSSSEKAAEHVFSPPMIFSNSKAYVVLNKHTMKVKESLNLTFDESPPPTKLSPLVDDDVGEEEVIENNTKVVNNSNKEDESIEVDEVVNIKESKNHPLE